MKHEKLCNGCGTVKKLREFWINLARPDGHEALCVECRQLKRGRVSAGRRWVDKDKVSPPEVKICSVPGCITKINSFHVKKGWETCMRHDGSVLEGIFDG